MRKPILEKKLFSRLLFYEVDYSLSLYGKVKFGHPLKQLQLCIPGTKKNRCNSVNVAFSLSEALLRCLETLGLATRCALHKINHEMSSQQRQTTVVPLTLIAFKICSCLWRLQGLSDVDM